MEDEQLIRQYTQEIRQSHGEGAFDAAQVRMRQVMDSGDLKAAGIWLSVLYELTRAEAEG